MMWNLQACRDLLISLDAQDVRTRSQESPWSQGKAPNAVNWLKEAAAAFGVSIKQSQAGGASGIFKNKGAIVDDVMRKITQIQEISPDTAAAEDDHLLENNVGRKGVCSEKRGTPKYNKSQKVYVFCICSISCISL